MVTRVVSQASSAIATVGDRRLLVPTRVRRSLNSVAFAAVVPVASTGPVLGIAPAPLAVAASVAADRWRPVPSAAGRPAVAFAAAHQVLATAPAGLEANA